jgi:hypothetical protein
MSQYAELLWTVVDTARKLSTSDRRRIVNMLGHIGHDMCSLTPTREVLKVYKMVAYNLNDLTCQNRARLVKMLSNDKLAAAPFPPSYTDDTVKIMRELTDACTTLGVVERRSVIRMTTFSRKTIGRLSPACQRVVGMVLQEDECLSWEMRIALVHAIDNINHRQTKHQEGTLSTFQNGVLRSLQKKMNKASVIYQKACKDYQIACFSFQADPVAGNVTDSYDPALDSELDPALDSESDEE